MHFIKLEVNTVAYYSNANFEANSHRLAKVTQHANKRAQQRCINKASLPLVLAYGKKEFDGQGGIRFLMTSDSITSLCRVVGRTKQVEVLAGVYAVVSAEDGTVITVGHRYN